MPMSELVQEMMFVNTCVKFRDNQLRNEACKVVTPFQYEQTYVWADPYIPCEGIIKVKPKTSKATRKNFLIFVFIVLCNTW